MARTYRLQGSFEGYLRDCGFQNLPAVQHREMRRAFFSGAAVLFEALCQEGADVALMESISKELREFGAEMDERCKDTIGVEDVTGKLPPFYDLARLPEDDRINMIGSIAETAVVGCMVDADDPVKRQRYIDKISKRFPKVRLISKTENGSGKLTILKFGPNPNA